MAPVFGAEDETIGELVSQLAADAKTMAKAEVELVQAGAKLRFARARTGLILAVLAIVVLHLSLVAGWVMLGIALATLIGPLASALVMLIGGALVAYLLVRVAISKIKPAFAPLPTGA